MACRVEQLRGLVVIDMFQHVFAVGLKVFAAHEPTGRLMRTKFVEIPNTRAFVEGTPEASASILGEYAQVGGRKDLSV